MGKIAVDDANSRIGYRGNSKSATYGDLNLYAAARWRVLDRIVDQYQEGASESVGIRLDVDGHRGRLKLETQAFIPRKFLALFDRFLHNRTGVNWLKIQRLLSGIGTCEQHQTVNDLGGTLRFMKNILQRFSVF
jgi:hypothetical protein